MDIIYRYDPYSVLATDRIDSPRESIQSLTEGHRRFRAIVDSVITEIVGGKPQEPMVIERNPLSLGYTAVGTPLHVPHALVLACSDARVPVERIFDHPQYGMFVVRVAGNVLGTECLGSIDYAVQNLRSLRLLIVLGHTGCGAVTAAVNSYLSPHDYPDLGLSHALRSLVDRLLSAVRGAARSLERYCGAAAGHDESYRNALIEAAVYTNAALTAFDVMNELKNMNNDQVEVVYAVYDVADRRVHFEPRHAGDDEAPLFGTIPSRAEALTEFSDRVMRTILERDHLLPGASKNAKASAAKAKPSQAKAPAKKTGKPRKAK